MTAKHLKTLGVIDLYEILRKLSNNATLDIAVQKFLKRSIDHKSMDIEAHAVIEDALYLGFKSPLDRQGNTVILRVMGVNGLFAGTIGHVEIWQEFKLLESNSGKPALLSDMVVQNDQLFLLGVVNHRRHLMSGLWAYNIDKKNLSQLATFPDLKAEGIAIRQDLGEALIVFDGGAKNPSQYTWIKI